MFMRLQTSIILKVRLTLSTSCWRVYVHSPGTLSCPISDVRDRLPNPLKPGPRLRRCYLRGVVTGNGSSVAPACDRRRGMQASIMWRGLSFSRNASPPRGFINTDGTLLLIFVFVYMFSSVFFPFLWLVSFPRYSFMAVPLAVCWVLPLVHVR